ncbi:MAG: cell division protein FtsZ [Rickettsiaceae bacterium]|nr:cell division protein FtsZ [Rickettsiaceae bacterium]MDP4832507.1 cell division protein FtsZ [Rickettsiaceae bacterium]MDP5020480.1 cell division protein FtsZ [Rickettsiaceae bacterium]MDP5083653.1 cell division protein FtsZ [Rickettsiaceae bacterium]
MGLEIKAPENVVLKPIITVFGVGGAGGNAVNNMIKSNLKGANFVVTNTDAQALAHSESVNKIQLGASLTKGLGAGASPDIGKESAIESENEIRSHLEGSNMVFITAGMGGGTGTGASPIIAKLAKELGILTVGVVTKPFLFEGSKRMKAAEKGLMELQKYVDTLIVIPNQNLFRIANEHTTFQEAFEMADEVLHAGVRGVTDLITSPGLVNLDFADIETVMREKGKAMMGTGEASGEERAIKAAESAIANPLLDQSSMFGASGVLINITGGKDMTLYEVDSAANRIREEVGDSDANIIFGSTFNSELEGVIRVSVVATGIEQNDMDYVKSEEPVVVIEDETPEEEFFDNISVENHEPPSYQGYDNKITNAETDLQTKLEELAKQIDWNQAEQIRPLEKPTATVQKSKQSLLRRMWNSLKAPEAQEEQKEAQIEPRSTRDMSPPSAAAEHSSDIQDIPAFLRKDR